MYLGLVLAYIGGAIFINSIWPLLLLPVRHLFLWVGLVIAKEEAHLLSRFGDAYADYKKSVRRWV